MPRPGYLSYRITDDRRKWIDALAVRLGLDPSAEGVETTVIDFALQHALFGGERWTSHWCEPEESDVFQPRGTKCQYCGWEAPLRN
jgi:hypothetical protein